MLYELHTWEILPGRNKAFTDRFENVVLRLFKKHDIKLVLLLEPYIAPSNQITALLEWKSLTDRERDWDSFKSDPEWAAARTESEKDGPIVHHNSIIILREVPSITAALRK